MCVCVESRGKRVRLTDRKDIFKAETWNIIYRVDG